MQSLNNGCRINHGALPDSKVDNIERTKTHSIMGVRMQILSAA